MELIERLLDPIWLESTQVRLEHWFLTEALVTGTLVQLGLLLLCAAAAYPLSRPLLRGARRLENRVTGVERGLRMAVTALPGLCYLLVLLILAGLAQLAMAEAGRTTGLLNLVVSLLAAWVAIRLLTSLIRDREWARGVALTVWALAALNILGLLGPAMELLDQFAFSLGERRISALTVVNAVILLVLLLWAARILGRFVTARIDRSRVLTPSIKVLTQKTLHILLLAAAFLFTLDYLGVDLTAFAVFTGAVGVGVGFGLQKVVSNLISGFILLLDRSIKPGDVIELEETFGWVTSLGARYVALSTRDGKEWLIPNEDLITQRVINWTYLNNRLRLPLKFGVSYHSDVRRAMEVAVEAAASVERVLTDPAPVCRLVGFGDSSVDFELRVWIHDAQAGVVNVRSEVFLELWDRFRAEGIEIPYPQRDLHIQPGSELSVSLSKKEPPRG